MPAWQVHVRDVARALWLLCSEGESGGVYNLADKGDTGTRAGEVERLSPDSHPPTAQTRAR